MIADTAIIDRTARVADTATIWDFSKVLAGASVGEGASIGMWCEIGGEIGVGCKIQSHVSVYAGVILDEDVFVGPSVTFTNVNTPRAFISRKNQLGKIHVKRGATVGANATIVCPPFPRTRVIGAYAMIGAGSVVTKGVPPHALVCGNPARQKGWVSEAGEALGENLVCPRTGEQYVLDRHLLKKMESGDVLVDS